MITFKINITPKPAPRPRVSQYGRVYMPNDYKEYVKEIQEQVTSQLSICSNEFVGLDITFYKNRNPRHKIFGDIDNLLKGVMDALIGLAYFDDGQVLEVHAKKVQSDQEGIQVSIFNL